MDRIGYYEEDGKLKMEWQEVTPVTEDEAKGIFIVKEKPVFLQIFFHRALEEDELFDIYAVLIEHHIIEMTREEMDKAIREDLERQPMGTWELKCDFKDAFECALRLGDDILFHENAFHFQISDEPTEHMKHWLTDRDRLKKMTSEKADDFDSGIYHDDSIESVDIDKNREMNFLSRLIGRMTLNCATEEEISDIVKYSMVVIDAKKKLLNWKQAAIDFRVQEMQAKYMQGGDEE